ncbi:MAG TPA: DUF167 domain-containing protein [Chloroflexota bacterium]|nr:DUF167 domain-containing protein [Chloroflexota bacterium]
MQIAVTEDGCEFSVYVTPRAGRTEVAGERDGALWVRLAAPPVGGAANAALIEVMAERLGVPRGAVRLVSGMSGRRKRVRVAGVSAAAAAAALTSPGEGRMR